MTEHGAATDAWPQLYEKVLAADILVIAGPIWLGDNSSVTKRVIERLYACSHLLNDAGQYAYYGRVGGCLITGNEDGVKHCAMNVLYSLQHLGLRHPAAGRRRLDRRGRARPVLPRPRLGRPGQRLHQPQHHLHDLEPAAPGPACSRTPAASPPTATSAPAGTPAAATTSTTPTTGRPGGASAAPDPAPSRRSHAPVQEKILIYPNECVIPHPLIDPAVPGAPGRCAPRPGKPY